MRKSPLISAFSSCLLLSTTVIGYGASLHPTAIASPVPATKPLCNLQSNAYAPLRSALNAKNWQAANRETRRLLEKWVHPKGDLFSTPQANHIPVAVLQTLDRLWLEASNGRFGFSVQQRIWRQVSAQHRNDNSAVVQAFGRRVGWLRPTPDNNNFVSPEWFIEPELPNSTQAPVGMFPWIGVSWERIQNMLNQQSCGSCMIDAMYLQGDRFYRYIPTLYNRIQAALATPTQPGFQCWR